MLVFTKRSTVQLYVLLSKLFNRHMGGWWVGRVVFKLKDSVLPSTFANFTCKIETCFRMERVVVKRTVKSFAILPQTTLPALASAF